MLYSFELFGQTLYGYSSFWTLGFVLGFILLFILNFKGVAGRVPLLDFLLIYTGIVLAIIYGSMAMSYIYQLLFTDVIAKYGLSWQTLSNIGTGNLLYGGMLAFLGFLLLYAKIFRHSFKKLLGIFLPFGPLFLLFARLGCFSAGCCYGVPSSFGYIFPSTSFGPAPGGVRLFPTQLTEAALGLILLIVMLILQRKWKEEKAYLNLPLFLSAYCTTSFLLDFVRGDAGEKYLGITVSQWASLTLLVCVAVWFIFAKKKRII